jgi:asparagine synthase (glutamine-hydrolysing)
MCGIAGIQVKPGAALPLPALDTLARALWHRGPDATGRFVAPNTALVSTRLAIVDVAHGDQPLFSPRGVALVANGEIYNAPELREEFPDYPFKTHSDCELALPLYEKYGLAFAEHLRGMYAVALYDPETEALVLARDPFGIKPLYYTEHETVFAFASEMGALLEAELARRDTEKRAESELLQLKYVIGTKTIIPGMRRVEAGETVSIRNGAIQERRTLSFQRPSGRKPSAYSAVGVFRRASPSLLAELEKTLSDSVAVHLRADVPCCLFYSGGVDSTILMLAAKEVSPQPLTAITVGYPGEEKADETRGAQELAAAAGTPCERIEMSGEDFWALAPQIAAAMDDPMADPAVLPLYMLARAAHERCFKVALSGEGSDEMFGGYSRYRRATLPSFLRRKGERRGVFSGSPIPAGKFDGWSRDMDALEGRERRRWSSQQQVLQSIDMLERLPNCLLIKLDRALMAHGVEGRTPFLDREMIRFANELPDGMKANPLFGKRILRDWLAKRFPQAKPYARKRGFDVPLRTWLAAHPETAELVAGAPGIRALFDPAEVKAVFEHVPEDIQPAWSLLFYALWHAHHMLSVDAEGNVAAVLSQACVAG